MTSEHMLVDCENCHTQIRFEQPYPYHAGFGNQGFLYDDAGTSTLVWSSFDPAYIGLVGHRHPFVLYPSSVDVSDGGFGRILQNQG